MLRSGFRILNLFTAFCQGWSRLLCRGLSEYPGWFVVAQQESRNLERILSRFADKWNRGFNRWVETLLLIKEAILYRVSQQPAVLIPYERCAMLRKEGFVSHRLRYDRRWHGIKQFLR